MIGSKISVEVADAKGNKDVSDETAPVAVYEELEILSAEQTAAKTVALTFSDDVDADDKLEVKKGSKTVTIEDTTYGDDSAVITLADKIVGGATYTVTLTPANGDPATSAEFIGETATLGEIVFINDVLVMKDSKYSKGFAYVKGYDQYGDEINLSGLTVTPGVGVFESYDPSTGKITIDSGVDTENGETSPFLLMKEVPVFVQYQNGTDILSTQANLAISSRAYLSDMEFGEIKKDGTARPDGRLTITELSSKKYYIEIDNPTDQYGNALTSDDLNDQLEEHVLFVIPGDSGAFYQTGKFGTIKDQTILWLEDCGGDSRPGTMTLTITGAGGTTFAEDVTIEDDPFIQALNVTYPMLYANVAASDSLEFSAVDQYGEPIDLWDFVPKNEDGNGAASVKAITFTDRNHMTNRKTEITLSGNARFNEIKTNAGKKTFTVTINTATDAAKKGDIISFVTTTAGMNVKTASVTVGNEGKAAKIKNTGSSVMLNANGRGGDAKYDFNAKLQFEDANGNTMKRSDADYPVYSAIGAIIDPTAGDAGTPGPRILLTAPNNYTPTNYYWTLSDTKLTAAGLPTNARLGSTVDGEFNVDGMQDDAGNATATDDIYVILWAENAAGVAVLLDQEAFHFTQVVGDEETYTAACADTLYVKKDSADSVTVKVTAKTDKGETYEVDGSLVRVSGIPFATTNNSVSGTYDLDEAGTKTASVFVNTPLEGWKEVASVDINYSNAAPVPTKVSWGGKSTLTGSRNDSKYGTKISVAGPDEFDTVNATSVTISGGKMSIGKANGFQDNLEACIKDQYDNVVTSTVFKSNGAIITKANKLAVGKNVIEFSAGDVVGRFTMNVAKEITPTIPTSQTVNSEDALNAAIAAGINSITIAKDIKLTADLKIENGVTVTVASGVVLDTNSNKLQVLDGSKLVINGELLTDKDVTLDDGATITVNGSWTTNAAAKISGDATDVDANLDFTNVINGSGHVNFTNAEIGGGIKFDVKGTTLRLEKVNFTTNNTQLGGHVVFLDTVAVGVNLVELQRGLDLDLTAAPTITGTFAIAEDAVVDIETTTGSTVTIQASADDTGLTITSAGDVTGGSYTEVTSDLDEGVELSTLSGQLTDEIKVTANLNAAVSFKKTGSADGAGFVTRIYTVTGTVDKMGSDVQTALGYGDAAYNNYYAWRFVGSGIKDVNRYVASGATADAAIENVDAKITNGATIDDPAVTTPYTDYVIAWTGANKFIALAYEINGVTYYHVYNMTAVNSET